MEPTPVREFQIAPMYRRCCWYVIVGFAVIAGVAYAIQPMFPQRRPGGIVVALIGYATIMLAMVVPLCSKLRIDEHGISRRLLFYWDDWSWSDFASGQIRKLLSHTLYDPSRPWWRRRLGLSHLEDRDRRFVLGAINAFYVLPPPPQVPEKLTLKYGFRRKAVLNADGIQLFHKKQSREYPWNDLRHVHISRLDSLRRDFRSLLIFLPDEEIELQHVTHQGGTSPTWRGATAEEINAFLFAHVPADRIEISTPEEPTWNRELIERKLAESKQQLRTMTVCLAVFAPFLIGAFVWMAVEDGVLKAVFMFAWMCVVLVPVFVVIHRGHRRRIVKMTELLAELGLQNSSSN